jgi:predicted nicotinamide N-methyase
MADRVIPWLRALAGSGVTVLMGDPGRAYLPAQGLVEVAPMTCRPRRNWKTASCA